MGYLKKKYCNKESNELNAAFAGCDFFMHQKF